MVYYWGGMKFTRSRDGLWRNQTAQGSHWHTWAECVKRAHAELAHSCKIMRQCGDAAA